MKVLISHRKSCRLGNSLSTAYGNSYLVIISAENEKNFMSRVINLNLLHSNNVFDRGHLMLILFTTLGSCRIT